MTSTVPVPAGASAVTVVLLTAIRLHAYGSRASLASETGRPSAGISVAKLPQAEPGGRERVEAHDWRARPVCGPLLDALSFACKGAEVPYDDRVTG